MKIFKQLVAKNGNCRRSFLSDSKMAPFSIILKKIICHLLCFAGNCDTTDQRSQATKEQEADIMVFLGKDSQAEQARPSSSRFRIKGKSIVLPKDTRPQEAPKHVTDAGRQDAKHLPTTPYPLPQTIPPLEATATTTASLSVRNKNPPLLQPYPSRQSPPPKLSQFAMSMSTLKKTLDTLHLIFSHTRYMVIGTAAMSIWGFVPSHSKYLPRQISILCTADDLPIIRSWAASMPYCVAFPGWSDMIGVVINGKIRGVKIKTVSLETFERVERVSPLELNKRERFRGWRENIMRTGAWVLGLGGMLDLLVGGWMVYHCKKEKTKKEEERLERCGRWILWILRRWRDDSRLGRGGEEGWELNNNNNNRVAREEFWVPFTGVWPESVWLLLRLGLLKESNSGLSSPQQELKQRKVWTGRRWLFVTSVASVSSEEKEGKGKGKEEHVSLTTLASSGCRPDSEDSEPLEMLTTRMDPDLARFHPDSFRVRAGLRGGGVSMREYIALVACTSGARE
ncbi:hypothetical protein QBC36DRAFT_346221 [Triangularia setosa]|uniref:Uncharacterized protein n=1 Tax=Triangularia setosa TaxID=2587417 RepID=A0AAN6W9G9_9PEZI|nr:hypothetical protein QBC36DRAFT_346221 [Podospora setosa]